LLSCDERLAVLSETMGCASSSFATIFMSDLHERSVLLEKSKLSAEQRQVLARAVMQEEDDWLDWKVAQEMIESWIGLQQEIGT